MSCCERPRSRNYASAAATRDRTSGLARPAIRAGTVEQTSRRFRRTAGSRVPLVSNDGVIPPQDWNAVVRADSVEMTRVLIDVRMGEVSAKHLLLENRAATPNVGWRDPDSNRGHHDFQSCFLDARVPRIAGDSHDPRRLAPVDTFPDFASVCRSLRPTKAVVGLFVATI